MKVHEFFFELLCRVVEVKGAEMARKAIDILHRSEIKGRRIIVREVGALSYANGNACIELQKISQISG
jgi:hypothetical protein